MELKSVSAAKHRILQNYLPAWLRILASWKRHLTYIDAFAGPGVYSRGEAGSPVIALSVANAIAPSAGAHVDLVFLEKSTHTASTLRKQLEAAGEPTPGVSQSVIVADSREKLAEVVRATAPSSALFVFIDPFGYPTDMSVIQTILAHRQAEVLVNLMWYRLRMDLRKEDKREAFARIFGLPDWSADLVLSPGRAPESVFLELYAKQSRAKFALPFRLRFGPEERHVGASHRTKYYLLHLSNHAKAMQLMKHAMLRSGDDNSALEYGADLHPHLFAGGGLPTLDEEIRAHYVGTGKELTFLQLQSETYHLPYDVSDYRKAVKSLEGHHLRVERRESKRTGINDGDLLIFPRAGEMDAETHG